MIIAKCESCGYSQEFDLKNAGRQFKCPICSAALNIPELATVQEKAVDERHSSPATQPPASTGKEKNTFRKLIIGVCVAGAVVGGIFLIQQSPKDIPPRLQELEITDIQGHRNFQDEEITKLSGANQAAGFRRLRGIYRRLGTAKNQKTTEYNYYMVRLYSKFNFIPISPDYYDSVTKKMILAEEYSNIYDSLYYYADELINNTNHPVVPAAFIAEAMAQEQERYKLDRKQIPYSGNRNSTLTNQRLNNLVNNSLSYYQQDTSTNKIRARIILDYCYYQLSFSADFKKPKKDNNNLAMLSRLYEIWQIMKTHRSDKPALFKWNYGIIERQDLPAMRMAFNALKKQSEEPRKVVSPRKGPQPLSWYCANLIGRSTSDVQAIIGMQDDCYNCNSTSGEMQYRYSTYDAMGTVTRLTVYYYQGRVTWLRAGYSYGPYRPDDSNDCK